MALYNRKRSFLSIAGYSKCFRLSIRVSFWSEYWLRCFKADSNSLDKSVLFAARKGTSINSRNNPDNKYLFIGYIHLK